MQFGARCLAALTIFDLSPAGECNQCDLGELGSHSNATRDFVPVHLGHGDVEAQPVQPAELVLERQRVELFDDVRPALERLAARWPVVALSNGNADLARVGLAGYFKAGLSAQVFGVGKPDRRIFEAAAQAAGVPPDEVLHIGDDAELDVLAALACGMQTAWVNREDKLWPHAAEPHETVRSLAELTALF